MRCVIYDPEDMEPLTIFDVPGEYLRALERGQFPNPIRFPIREPMEWRPWVGAEEPTMPEMKVASVLFEKLHRNGVVVWTGMAMNPEVCLLLKSDFLPGQQKEVLAERRKGFAEGFLEAFKLLGYGQ
jgi:hypothetical protein